MESLKTITDEMRKKLRVPLPDEAVSQHPTKSYLSSIKSIYVAERINDVFGLGTWTLKGEPVEILEKNVVMRVALEIPEYGFYGEAYGGNDNPDRGDAFKGAVTDGFTKIAAQQLEIGIAVFKGIHGDDKPKPVRQREKESDTPEDTPPQSAVDELFNWVAANMNWKSSKAAMTWIVNVCKIPESKINADPKGVKQEIAASQGWTL